MAGRVTRAEEGRAVLAETWGVLREWVGALPAESYSTPSVLDGWTIGDLLAHLARGVDVLTRVEPAPSGVHPASISTYVSGYQDAAPVITERARDLARETARDPLGALDATWRRADEALDALLTRAPSGALVVTAPRGPITVSDLIDTRLLELVVHADDLHRSLAGRPPAALPRDAQRRVVRTLLDVLVERAPGRSVEVRVPPFAAVQCVEGPRHTRGTPPNVVEADPMTWVRLACGRVSWAEAVADGSARASGERADLSGLLPLL